MELFTFKPKIKKKKANSYGFQKKDSPDILG